MRAVRLVSFQDQVTGETGMGFKGHTSHERLLSDRSGLLIAHDIVEHQNGLDKIGGCDDELEAMGGAWHIRGMQGRLGNSYYSAHHSVGHDVANIYRDLVYEEDNNWWPRLERYHTQECDYEEDFQEILEVARKTIRDEHKDDECYDPHLVDAFLDNALHLMRIGFRKSIRRWGWWRGSQTFDAITQAVKREATSIHGEGQEFILRYGDGVATCREVELHEMEEW